MPKIYVDTGPHSQVRVGLFTLLILSPMLFIVGMLRLVAWVARGFR